MQNSLLKFNGAAKKTTVSLVIQNLRELLAAMISDTFPEKKGKTSKSKETLYATLQTNQCVSHSSRKVKLDKKIL